MPDEFVTPSINKDYLTLPYPGHTNESQGLTTFSTKFKLQRKINMPGS